MENTSAPAASTLISKLTITEDTKVSGASVGRELCGENKVSVRQDQAMRDGEREEEEGIDGAAQCRGG